MNSAVFLSKKVYFMNITRQNTPPLWERLQKEERPIVLYGMGNGADKILKVCDLYGIVISGVFASDDFAKKKLFHGMPVMKYADLKEILGVSPVVLLSFATSRDEVLENIYKIAADTQLFAPDVPVYGDTLFTYEYFDEHRAEFEEVYSLLADERSKKLYEDIIRYKISGDISYLSEIDKEEEYMQDILGAERFSSFVDAGAYRGDTAIAQMKYSPKLKKIYAVEPDHKTYKRLCESIAPYSVSFSPFCAALGNENTEMAFFGDGGRGSTLTKEGKRTVSVRRLDDLLDVDSPDFLAPDYIKYDVEGMEADALLGSQKTIEKYRPSLLVSLYHRSEDLIDLPLMIKNSYPGVKFYLRRLKGLPAWDLNLLVVPY